MSDKDSNISKMVTLTQAVKELGIYVEDIHKGIKSGEIPIGEVIRDDKLGITKYYIYRTKLDAYKDKKKRERVRTKKQG